MARVYEWLAARALGTAGGLLMFGTGAGMYVFMGATASNVPLPGRLEATIHEAAPALEASAGQAMPLPPLAVFGLVCLVLVGIGLRNVLEALLKDDFILKVTSQGGDRQYQSVLNPA
ncbi:hypothetical protein BRD14_06970 [Halobacteriales archaeon SW_5_68_122]|nr:MAG: hypothetical protein BRD14_06970 [Halobacteriales archaeon SW_5_68_122]